MATGPNYSRISVNDNGFYIIDSTDGTLSSGVSFDASAVTELRKITLPDKTGTLAFLDDIGTATSVAADDITPGDASVLITTTAGGVSIDTDSGSSLVLNHGGLPQISLGSETMKLLENKPYTITHTSDEAGEDLTIHQAGVIDSSLVLKSSGTGQDAVYLYADNAAGGIKVQSGTNGLAIDTTGAFSIDATAAESASNITHAGSGGVDLTISATNSSLVLTGGEDANDAVKINASDAAGGIDIDSGTGGFTLDTSGAFSIDATASGSASNITHAGSAGNDLTIGATSGSLVLTGGEAAIDAVDIRSTNAAGGVSIRSGTVGTSIVSTGNVVLSSSDSGSNAITLNASEGSVNIVSKLGEKPVIMQNHTKYYGIDKTQTSITLDDLITISDVVDATLSSSHFVTARFSVTSGGISGGGYIVDGLFLYDKSTLTLQGTSQGIGYGNADDTGTGYAFDHTDIVASGTDIIVKYKSTSTNSTQISGLVTVTTTTQ